MTIQLRQPLEIEPDMSKRLYKPGCGMARECFAAFLGDLATTATVTSLPSREMKLQPRREIYAEGDEAYDIYEIKEGVVMLYRLLPDGRRQVVELLGKGDLFGLSFGETHDCYAETLRPCRITAFERKAAEENPALQRMMANATRRQLQQAHEHALTLGRRTAQERVASFILRIFRTSDEARDLSLPMTRQEIADFLGLTIETVSRVFSSFRKSGLLSHLQGEKLSIADVDALEELAEAF